MKKKTVAQLKKDLQKLVNRYARLRDCKDGGANCISCGEYKSFEDLDGGHFIATTSSAVRFDERNINAQCIKCNRFLGGNARHYLKGMIKKYGQEVVDELESQEFTIRKWRADELIDLIQDYKLKLKELE
jgi:hypothetical protein